MLLKSARKIALCCKIFNPGNSKLQFPNPPSGSAQASTENHRNKIWGLVICIKDHFSKHSCRSLSMDAWSTIYLNIFTPHDAWSTTLLRVKETLKAKEPEEDDLT